MEDEGRIGDHTAGIAATDGSWHHIAVSWSSHDGLATLYDNGHKVWLIARAGNCSIECYLMALSSAGHKSHIAMLGPSFTHQCGKHCLASRKAVQCEGFLYRLVNEASACLQMPSAMQKSPAGIFRPAGACLS